MIGNKEFLEQRGRLGFSYGTTTKDFEKAIQSGKVPLLKMSVEGSLNIDKMGIKEANRIVIIPPNPTIFRAQMESS